MDRTAYLQYLSEKARGKKISPSEALAKLQVMLTDIKQNAKYYSPQWYIDQLQGYRRLAKETYLAISYQAQESIKTTDERIKEVEARVYQHKTENQDTINLINSLVVRITTEIKLNPDNAASILENIKILRKEQGQ